MRSRLILAGLVAFAAFAVPCVVTARGGDPAPAAAAKSEEPKGLAVGDAAPSAALVDVRTGKLLQSETLWKDRPVVVVFYRGGWCPFCTKSLAEWQPKVAEIKAAGAGIVAVAMEKPDLAMGMVEKHKLSCMVLADPTGDACRAFKTLFDLDDATKQKYEGYGIDLSKRNANGAWQLPVPATYIIDTQGKVRFVHFDPDYRVRASPDAVIAKLKEMTPAAR